MSETPVEYTVTTYPVVTITISAEWADFLRRAQTARNEWARHRAVSHIAIVDWRSLGLRAVSLDDNT